MEPVKATPNLQLELLTLLAFYDKEGKYIRSIVELDLYDSKPVQNLAKDLYRFIDSFNTAPKEHFAEIIGPYLKDSDKSLYEQLHNKLMQLRSGINPEYVLSQLDDFLATQNLYLGITKAFSALEKKDVETAKKVMYEAAKVPTVFNDPGLKLSDSLDLLYAPDPRLEFTSGIPQLDERRFTPARGELMLILGLSGKGKSWGLIHMGSCNFMKGKKILHISLEMAARQVATRYTQNLMFLKRHEGENISYFKIMEGPADDYITQRENKFVFGLKDPQVISKIGEKLKLFENIVIKNWPPNVLTINKLEGYLDMLEQVHGFMPDMLLVDYPDRFKLPKSGERRVEIGEVITNLRRIGIQRNMAVIAPTQSNRGGKSRAILTEEDISEDFSKFMEADCCASFNATDEEYKIGIMRIQVLKNRDDFDRYGVIINQLLQAGQFVVSSAFYHEQPYKDWISQFGNGGSTVD